MKSRSAACSLFFAIATRSVLGFVSYSHSGLLLRSPVSAEHSNAFLHLFAVNDDDSSNNEVEKDNDSMNQESSSTYENEEEEQQQRQPLMQTSTIKIDDGGSDLTDRFKYKVQALMGNFDPADATNDTEESTGNILNAMMQFPCLYTFNVVGQLDAANDAAQDAFVQAALDTIRQGAGLRDDAPLQAAIVPRGTKFVKVSVAATVESAAMITDIYDALQAMPASVMQF